VNANWLGVPRLRNLHNIGAHGIKTWCAFGAPSHFLLLKPLSVFILYNTIAHCYRPTPIH